MANKHLKDKPKVKKILRVVGFISLSIGIICIIVAFVDFFSGFPKLFYLFFIGFPFVFVGAVCLNLGFMREIGEYTASQTAPVTKKFANYMLDGTREELTKTINSIRGKKNNQGPICSSCETINEEGANFCDNCGNKLVKSCDCGEDNDADAKYCRKCGEVL